MDMNYQQRAEYIEQCRRDIAVQDAALQKATLDHELESQRIAIESQLKIHQLMSETFKQARVMELVTFADAKKITVAM